MNSFDNDYDVSNFYWFSVFFCVHRIREPLEKFAHARRLIQNYSTLRICIIGPNCTIGISQGKPAKANFQTLNDGSSLCSNPPPCCSMAIACTGCGFNRCNRERGWKQRSKRESKRVWLLCLGIAMARHLLPTHPPLLFLQCLLPRVILY